jgi:hypothetical protein
MEIVLWQENSAAFLCDKGMGMSELAAWFVQLEASAAGQPNGRDGGVLEGGDEFLEAKNRPSTRRKEIINSEVDDSGGLAQTGLPTEALILAELPGTPETLSEIRKRAGCPARFALAPAESPWSFVRLLARSG